VTAPAPSRSPDLTVGIALAALGYLLGGLGASLILLARDLDIPRAELGWMSSSFGAAMIAVGAAGPWLLRAGAGRVLRAASAALGAGFALLAVAPDLLVGQVAAVLLGVGGAGLVLAGPAAMTGPDLAARLTRVNAASSVASVCAPLLIGALEVAIGSGRLALLVPVPAILWIAATGAPIATPVEPRITAEHVALRAGAGWLCIVLAVAAEFCFLIWGAARLQDSGLGAAAAAGAAAAFPIGMAAGRLAAPAFMGKAPAAVLGALLAMAATLPMAAPVGPAGVILALAAAGLGISVLYPVMLARLVRALPPGRGAALGTVASGTAALAAPALLGALAAPLGLRIAFLLVVPLLVALLALEHVTGTRPRPPAPPPRRTRPPR